jgi:hypothetical protein
VRLLTDCALSSGGHVPVASAKGRRARARSSAARVRRRTVRVPPGGSLVSGAPGETGTHDRRWRHRSSPQRSPHGPTAPPPVLRCNTRSGQRAGPRILQPRMSVR